MSRYARLVEQTLRELPGFEDSFELETLHLSMPRNIYESFPSRLRMWANHAWLMVRGPAQVARCKPGLVHLLDGSYGYLLTSLGAVPMIATVHDLIPLLQQQGRFGHDQTSFLARWVVKRSISGLGRCSALIADSLNTRKDLEEAAQIRNLQISVIPIAMDSIYRDTPQNDFPRDVSSLEDQLPVILHVGHNGHYKNRAGVLRIFACVRSSVDCRLVLVGAAPSESLLRMVLELGMENDVEFAGEVDDLTLRGLYRRASVFLFPSLYEGFGWPPLEAMACGCPVVSSTDGSLAEVVGDAALTAPASDEQQLAHHCLSVLQNPALAETLSVRGKRHAAQYTSERMGAQLMEAYQKSLGGQVMITEAQVG
jgi:glycosyltransferase involved in cell wall biosynthesis